MSISIKSTVRFPRVYPSDDISESVIKPEFEEFASKMKGVVTIAGISCDEEPAICEKEGITEYPIIRVYHKNPIPVTDFTAETYDISKIRKTATRLIENKATEIT